ncbi:hypothetical protein YC2023_115468 [Brassica napus]
MLMILFRKLTKPALPHSNQQTKASFKTSEINHNTKDLQSAGKLEDHQPPCLRLLQIELQNRDRNSQRVFVDRCIMRL